MLTFERLRLIFNSFNLIEYTIKKGAMYNYKYKGKVLVTQVYPPTGNGYIWGKEVMKYTSQYTVDERGWTSIKGLSEQQIRDLLSQVLSMQEKLAKN